MKNILIVGVIASTLSLVGCASVVPTQKGTPLQTFPQVPQLEVQTARPLALRTETVNAACDVTTFFQVMSERNPDIQNIIDIHYSETKFMGHTECSYWGVGVTYKGVASRLSDLQPVEKTAAPAPVVKTIDESGTAQVQTVAPSTPVQEQNPEIAPVNSTEPAPLTEPDIQMLQSSSDQAVTPAAASEAQPETAAPMKEIPVEEDW